MSCRASDHAQLDPCQLDVLPFGPDDSDIEKVLPDVDTSYYRTWIELERADGDPYNC